MANAGMTVGFVEDGGSGINGCQDAGSDNAARLQVLYGCLYRPRDWPRLCISGVFCAMRSDQS
jgi:hypothetical protein